MNGVLNLYLINDETGIFCNHYFVDFFDDNRNLSFIENNETINNDWKYLSNNSKDKMNNMIIGKWLNDNYPKAKEFIAYNHVSYQQISLEEFISQSLKILRVFEKYNQEINNFEKFKFMLNWKG